MDGEVLELKNRIEILEVSIETYINPEVIMSLPFNFLS